MQPLQKALATVLTNYASSASYLNVSVTVLLPEAFGCRALTYIVSVVRTTSYQPVFSVLASISACSGALCPIHTPTSTLTSTAGMKFINMLLFYEGCLAL